jgi:polyisoprenoid-binding protein YceI
MIRWKTAVVITSLLLAPLRASAEEKVLILQAEKTSVTFLLKATGHQVDGVLALQSGQIRFDTRTGTASGEVTIDLRHAATGNRLRDRQMHREVLESERFPLIIFRPDRIGGAIAPAGTADIALHGTVSIHGMDNELTVPAKVTLSGNRLTAEATVDVPYVEWGLHDPSFLFLRVSRVVTVTVRTEGEVHPASVGAAESGPQRGAPAEEATGPRRP